MVNFSPYRMNLAINSVFIVEVMDEFMWYIAYLYSNIY